MSEADIAALEARIVALEEGGVFITTLNADQIWVLIAGFLVFFMHAGFTMLEAGSVRHKNAINILYKNIGTVSIGSVFYYLLGYGFAYGEDNIDKDNFSFIGSGNFALHGVANEDRHSFFFQAVFAATAATIVSGAVAGRVNLLSYFGAAAFLTAFVYPVISHWIWATGGWASAFTDKEDTVFGPEGCGFLDFAGSGVVHLTGGAAAFWGALILGPRLGRFDANGDVVAIPPHNVTVQALGVMILWFGWYGFNCGSTLAFNGPVASKVAVTTTLSPSMAVITSIFLGRYVHGHYDIGTALNCALAGLVAITAGCSVVDDWAALIIGFVAAFVYVGASKLMLKMHIDDPVDAIAVHGFNGIWGCLAVGIFGTPELIAGAYSDRQCSGWNTGLQFGTQIVGVLAIISWVTLMMVPFFFALKFAHVLRVPSTVEELGLDSSEHGGAKAFDDVDLTVEKAGAGPRSNAAPVSEPLAAAKPTDSEQQAEPTAEAATPPAGDAAATQAKTEDGDGGVTQV